MLHPHRTAPAAPASAGFFAPGFGGAGQGSNLIRVGSRRWFLQAGLAGLGGLALPGALGSVAQAVSPAGGSPATGNKKAVILFWLSGGPSHIDMWDPKPNAPREIRSPFGVTSTKVPGIQFTEELPLQASIADKLSILRSVDCSSSNHTPITMQAGNPLAKRTDNGRDGDGFPSMGSVVAKYRGANDRDMPPFIGLAESWASDVWEAGDLGQQYAPLKGHELVGKFGLPQGINLERLTHREQLRQEINRFQRDLQASRGIDSADLYTRQAYEMVASGKVHQAFNVEAETPETRAAYGNQSMGEKALLARRLVEAGATFVLVSGAWGYFDHHGDDVRWGGIEKGLRPLMPQVDRTLYTLITDLEQRGLLDSTLVMMMGEFGRSPVINKNAGRDHWTNVMSMVMAGGGLPHGQVIGSTDDRGAGIRTNPVRPQDLAATVFRYLDIDLNAHWTNPLGRPIPIVQEGGRPIPELI